MSHSSSSASASSFPSWFVIKLTALASLGGCLFGYDMGAISGALPQLTQQYGLTLNEQGWVVSILYLGGGVGAVVGGTICDQMGRLTTILITDALFALGAAWFIWIANSFEGLLIGRFLVGIAVAISGVADVAYLQEIAPQAWRGAIVSVNEACISLGFLLAFFAGYVYSDVETEGWRSIFGWAGILGFIQGIGMWNMPESPVWLATQGRWEESDIVYRLLQSTEDQLQPSSRRIGSSKDDDYDNHDHDYGEYALAGSSDAIPIVAAGTSPPSSYQASTERGGPQLIRSFDSMESVIGTGKGGGENNNNSCWSSKIYFIRKTFSIYYRQIWIAFFLAVTQQFCGQGAVLNYAPIILGGDSPTWSTLVVGGLKFVVTVIVIMKIESVGRRSLLLGGMSLITIGLLVLCMSSHNGMAHLVLPGVLAVVCGYSISFGPLTWLLTAELFPSDIRGRALGISTIVTYCAAAAVTRAFLPASEWLGYSSVFGLYAGICMTGILFAFVAIPETGDRSLEQIESSLDHMSFWGLRSPKKNDEGDTIMTTTSLEMSTTRLVPHPQERTSLSPRPRTTQPEDSRFLI